MRDKPERPKASAPWWIWLTLPAPLAFIAWSGWLVLGLQESRREDAGRAVAAVRLEALERSLLDLQQGSIVLWRYPVASDSLERWRELYKNYRNQVRQLEGKDPPVRDVMDDLLRLYAAVARTERIRQQLLTTKVPEEEARTLETEFRSKLDVALAEVKAAVMKVRASGFVLPDFRLWTGFAIVAAALAAATAGVLLLLGRRTLQMRAAQTELAANRQDVQELEVRWQSILDSAPDAFLVCDDTGIVQAANQGVQNLLGYLVSDLVGRSLTSVLPPLARRRSPGEGASGGPESGWVEIEVRRRDGANVALDVTVRKTVLTGEPATLALLRPAGKGRAEEVLRGDRDFLNSLFENTELMLAVLDDRGRITSVNGALERATGQSLGQVKGKLFEEVFQLEPLAGSPATFPALKGLCWVGQGEFRRRIAWRGANLAGKGGAIRNLVALGFDVTDYQAALAPVEPASEALGRLAVKVSHALSDSLTTISGHGELLLESLGPEDAARPDVEQILAAGQRASVVTGGLLAFTQRQMVETRKVNLNARIDALKPRLCEALGRGVVLSVEQDPALEPVNVDPERFDELLLILARNAGEAMPQGGKVTLRTENAGSAAAGVWVSVSLRDSGAGMDAETRKRLFEPFFTTKDPRKALGLGLATVRGIASRSGGRVEVESAPGAGTKVSILLPPAAGASAAHA